MSFLINPYIFGTSSTPSYQGDMFAYYGMNNNVEDAFDSHDGSLGGTTAFDSTTKLTGSHSINFTNGYFDAGGPGDFSFVDGDGDMPFSVSFAFNPTSTTTQVFMEYGNSGALNRNWSISFISGSPQFTLRTDSSNNKSVRTTSTLSTSTWYYLTFAWDTTNAKIFIDNSEASTTDLSSGTYTGMPGGLRTMRIGSRIGALPVNGRMDALGFFNEALSLSQHQNNRTIVLSGSELIT